MFSYDLFGSRMGENGRNIDSQTTRGTTTRDGTTPVEQVPGIKNVECSNRKKKSLRARYAYGVIFLLTNIIGWLFRDYGEKILPMLPCKSHCLIVTATYDICKEVG